MDAPRVAAAPERRDAEDPALAVRGPLAVKADGRLRLIEQNTIDWIEADDDHVIVHAGASAWRTRERLTEVERRLDPRRFVRIHRSTVVQVNRVRELEPWFHGDYVVVMQSGAKLRLSRTRREHVAKLLGRAL
jgi:two-component system LytT family response regulator